MEYNLHDEPECFCEECQNKNRKNSILELLAEALTEDISEWFKDWSAGDSFGFEAKTDIYNVIHSRLKKGLEI